MYYILELSGHQYLIHGKVEDVLSIISKLEPVSQEYVDCKYLYTPSGDNVMIGIETISEKDIRYLDKSEMIELEIKTTQKEASRNYDWYITERGKVEKLQSQVDQLLQCISELKGNSNKPEGGEPEKPMSNE